MTASIVYEGNLRCSARHIQSGYELETDAPTDNHGKGERFSPTDLVCTALGTCILTTMAIKAGSMGIDLGASTAHVTKHMQAAPRKIAAIDIEIILKTGREISEKEREILILTGNTCPVAKSLHPDVVMNIRYT